MPNHSRQFFDMINKMTRLINFVDDVFDDANVADVGQSVEAVSESWSPCMLGTPMGVEVLSLRRDDPPH